MLQSAHLPVEILVGYAEDQLDAPDAERVRAHLAAGCARCERELASWSRCFSALQADRAPAAPEVVLQRLYSVYDRYEAPPTLWERICAMLVFDSRLQPALAGARDASAGSFQLLYEGQGTEIDLMCEPDADGWQIAGQALVEDDAEIRWSVAAAPTGEAPGPEVAADARGEFRLAGLRPGAYDLVLRGQNREITLPGIKLPPA